MQKLYSKYERVNNFSSIVSKLPKWQNQNDKYLSGFLFSNHDIALQKNSKLYDQIIKIYAQQQSLEKGLAGIVRLLKHQPQANALLNAERFINFYTQKTITPALLHNDKKELEVVEKIQTTTTEIITSIEGNGYVTKDDLKKFETDIVTLINQHVEVLKKDKQNAKKIKNWEFVKNCLASIIISLAFWLIPSPTAEKTLTENDFEKAQRDALKQFSPILSQSKFFGTVNKSFQLRELPKFSSSRLLLIKKGVSIEVLNSNSSWAYIAAIDKEGYHVNGWIPKTFLSK